MNAIYQQIRYVTSVYDAGQLPPETRAEVAFAGRSNAGKSSAINVLCQRKGLAQISKTPGRTRTINFFSIDSQRYLVDLPGYGYAKLPAAMRAHWQSLVEHYLRRRRSLRGLIVMMDIRHPLTDSDWQLLSFCAKLDLPLHILLTKADKLSRGAAISSVGKAQRLLRERGVEAGLQAFSALKHEGLEEANKVLNRWLDLQTDHQ